MITPYPAPGDEPGGGVEVAAVRLVSALVARGEDVVVVTHGDAAREEVRDGTRVVRLEFADARMLARRYRPWRTAAGRVLDQVDADVVHGQGLLFGALPACDHPKRPRIATAHGSPAWDALGVGPGLSQRARGAAATALAATTIRRLDAVVSVHPDLRLHTRVRPRRFAYIPNIVAPPPGELPAREPRRVLYCGGTRWLKGFDRLREAWPIVRSIVPDARLHVVGWPAGVPLGLSAEDGVECEGLLTPAEVLSATARATVIVVPSRFEVAPVVISDAWSVRTPVVASTAGGIPGMAHDAALLVDAGSPAVLAGSIARCLLDPPATRALVDEGSRRVATMTAARVADAHVALYASLLRDAR